MELLLLGIQGCPYLLAQNGAIEDAYTALKETPGRALWAESMLSTQPGVGGPTKRVYIM